MKITSVQNYNYNYNFKSRQISAKNNRTDLPKENNIWVSVPTYYPQFKGGYSLNLPETVSRLDALAKTKSSVYPPNIREWLGMLLESGNFKGTLITAHKKYYENLEKYSSLEKIKELFPEFQDVISTDDIDTSNRDSFINKFLKGECEYFDTDEDLSVQLIKLYWGHGFSLNDLKNYTDGSNLYYTMKKLNIPLASKDYGHILKFSDPEYNERLTKEMTEKN